MSMAKVWAANRRDSLGLELSARATVDDRVVAGSHRGVGEIAREEEEGHALKSAAHTGRTTPHLVACGWPAACLYRTLAAKYFDDEPK
jgi:hypothetical protein